jgi:hypothetical protein
MPLATADHAVLDIDGGTVDLDYNVGRSIWLGDVGYLLQIFIQFTNY